MNIIEGHYLLSVASEAGVCFWTWTKSRQAETSSIACFRYALPMFFIYLINEVLSNDDGFPLLLAGKAISGRVGVCGR